MLNILQHKPHQDVKELSWFCVGGRAKKSYILPCCCHSFSQQADAQGSKGPGTKKIMWVVSTPDPSRWAAWVAARHGGRNVRERQRQGNIVGEQPAHMQQGFTTGVVVGMLDANIPVTDDEDRRGCLKQLVAKQGTVSKHFAVMVMLGAGLFSAQNLQELFGLPIGCAAGYEFVKGYHREIRPRDRKSVRPCAVRCPFATASPEFRTMPDQRGIYAGLGFCHGGGEGTFWPQPPEHVQHG